MIDVHNETDIPVLESALIELATFVLQEMRINPQSDLDIICVDENTIEGYHERFLDLAGPTDVMSFPMDELRPGKKHEEPPLGMLGDIVLCPAFIARQAEALGKTVQQEQEYLLVHGILHLLGFDHAEPAEEAEMFGLNDRLMAAWEEHKNVG